MLSDSFFFVKSIQYVLHDLMTDRWTPLWSLQYYSIKLIFVDRVEVSMVGTLKRQILILCLKCLLIIQGTYMLNMHLSIILILIKEGQSLL